MIAFFEFIYESMFNKTKRWSLPRDERLISWFHVAVGSSTIQYDKHVENIMPNIQPKTECSEVNVKNKLVWSYLLTENFM